MFLHYYRHCILEWQQQNIINYSLHKLLIMTELFIILADLALGQFGAAIGASIATIGAALGISRIGASALEAIARQPEASGDIRSNMIVSAALIEGVAFFALIICALVVLV